ncbi:unnamed protein product [Cylicocyclus nassatus]|uniref:C-type lectin domain-containing protein n=1 Tax=Cylicocyclus nassatus TaxID=53992 RepID=A0AA36GUF4_CYLNA|nr:unnamed protein product [Cylicocyclus nassatus]
MWLELFLSLALVLKALTYECPHSHYLFDDRCFAFVDGKGTQKEGRKQCLEIGYELVSIHDMINNRYAQQLAQAVLSFTYGNIWIGLHKENEIWKWLDNSTYDFMNWGRGINPAHQCAVMRISDGKWLSADCEMPYQALCSGFAFEPTTAHTDLPRNTTQAITTQKWTTTGEERTAVTTTEEGETKTRTPWRPVTPEYPTTGTVEETTTDDGRTKTTRRWEPETEATTGATEESTTDDGGRTKTVPKETRRCLFVGDLLNFDRRVPDYEKEMEFIAKIGYELLNRGVDAEGAIWAYGFTNAPEPEEKLKNMTKKIAKLQSDIKSTMTYVDRYKPNYSNKQIIWRLNNMTVVDEMANCLVFFSGAKNTDKLREKLISNENFKKVVVVSLRGANLTEHGGETVDVSNGYTEENVNIVVDKILDISPTEPPAPRHAGPHCLIAGDMLNFDRRIEEYEKESQFVLNIGEKLLDIEDAAVAIWSYGYVDDRSLAEALNRMTSNSRVFENEVRSRMAYAGNKNAQSNKQVLETLNNMSPTEWDGKANCLVYLSALKRANDLEKLIPKGDAVKRVVVVSLRGGDLSPLLDTHRGAMVIVDAAGGYTTKNAEDVIKAISSNIWN